MEQPLTINGDKFLGQVTRETEIEIKFSKRVYGWWKFRMTLGLLLVYVGVWITGMGVDIEYPGEGWDHDRR